MNPLSKKRLKSDIKKNYFLLVTLTFVFPSWTFSQSNPGKEIYERNCIRCHGAIGTKHFLGANDLQKSRLDDTAVALVIQNGKRWMPAYKKKISNEELVRLKEYVLSLRR